MTIEELALIAPEHRNTEIHKHTDWLETLNENELDEVGRLLCHGSARPIREEHPIIGDLPTKQRVAQEQYEAKFFGDPVKNDNGSRQDSRRGDMPIE